LGSLLLALPAAAATERWRPAPTASWQYQLQGEFDPSVLADVYDVDGFEVAADTVAALHARGRRAICYVNVGAWESWRPDADAFPPALLGRPLAGYPDERWLDIRRLDVLGPLLRARLELCRDKGFDGVEPDNVDGYTHATGFPLTAAAQLRFNRWVAREARRLDLAVGLKNDFAQVNTLVREFDFAVVEECFQFGECEKLLPFVRAGKAVFAVEYRLPLRAFCNRARKLRLSAIRKSVELGPARQACPR
jgi:hypothetical protein